MKVGILGLGFAGVRAAMLLEEAGHEVVCMEARDRVGGRCQTIQTQGGFFEAGGEWIDPHNHRIIDLLQSLGQFPTADEPARGRMRFRGELRHDDATWPELEALNEALEQAADEYLLDLEQPPWTNVLYPLLDSVSLSELLKKLALDPTALEAMRGILRSEEGEELEEISLLGWLCGYEFYRERGGGEGSPLRFPQGAQVFLEKLLQRVKGEKHFSFIVDRIHHGPFDVTVWAGGQSVVVDRLVLTAPGQALLGIEIEPPLSDAKELALGALPLGRTIKVSLEFSKPFWNENGWSGRYLSDGLLQQCWNGSRGECHVLLVYVNGDTASRLRSMSDPVDALLNELSAEFPKARECFVKGALHDWVGDPLAGGGFPHVQPGDVLEHWEDRIRSEGRLHFAGDATSTLIGYMEGALESAERVAQEIGKA